MTLRTTCVQCGKNLIVDAGSPRFCSREHSILWWRDRFRLATATADAGTVALATAQPCEACPDPTCPGPTSSPHDPHWDGTDAACACWYRGHAHTVDTICQMLNALLDDPIAAGGHEGCTPWSRTRARILRTALVAQGACMTCKGRGKIETYGTGERWCPVCHPAPQE